MTNVFVEAVLIYDGRICFNYGWAIQDVLMTLSTLVKLRDCYKVVIQSLTDWSNWTGQYASLIDKCSDSTGESITLYTWNPITVDQVNYWQGDSVYTTCSPGQVFAPNVAKALTTILDYYEASSKQQ